MGKYTEDAKALLEYVGGKRKHCSGITLCNTHEICIK